MYGSIQDRIPLRDGTQLPRSVFSPGADGPERAIHHAFDHGYRALDTAQMYKNEAVIGQGVRSYPDYQSGKLPRSEVYVTSKVEFPEGDVYAGIKESVEKIGLEYVDLFLVHNPRGGPEGRKKKWLGLEQAKRDGLVKSIGVSNYSIKHIEELKTYATELPVVNQIEIHPWTPDTELMDYCRKEGIVLQAYAPVTRGQKKDDPVLQEIVAETGKNWNKVLLRWGYQMGHSVICRSQTPSRITDNAEIFDFELSDGQMEKLNGLKTPGHRVCPNEYGQP